ncbi:hypothetical protein [Mycobacterium sp.]|uniref:hypothetical protein n=1 Tax=Mycobacterium sp. TaxID=1785 RepID=UPI003F997A5C
MSTASTAVPPNFVTASPFCERFDIPPGSLPRLIEEGLPFFRLDATRRVFPVDECEAWLREHGYFVDPYRAAIKKLIDDAPPLSADQAAKIRAVLGGAV